MDPVALPGTGWRIRRFDEVSSTNDTVLSAARNGAPEWTVHLARRQTRGRGRGSHEWWSPEDRGLWMSVLLRPRLDLPRIGGLALVAGVATREALLSVGAGPIDLFWPNDLEFRGRKLGGILCESRAQAGSTTSVALGIGLNIDLSGIEVPEALRDAVASIAEAGAVERDPERIAVRILERLLPLYRALEDGASIPSLIEGMISGVGLPVTVRIPPAPSWEGSVAGIGPEGELLVERRGGGLEGIRSAEVRYGRRPG